MNIDVREAKSPEGIYYAVEINREGQIKYKQFEKRCQAIGYVGDQLSEWLYPLTDQWFSV